MVVNRREFVSLASGSIAAGTLVSLSSALGADSPLRSRTKAIAFDGFRRDSASVGPGFGMNRVSSCLGQEKEFDALAPAVLANTLRTICAKEARWVLHSPAT
jgi:hypothetical protein